MVRGICIGLVATHAIERMLDPEPSLFWDLIIYNLIVFALAIALLKESKFLLGIGFACWGLSSTASSWFAYKNFSDSPIILDLGYALFFPFIVTHFLKFFLPFYR